MLKYLLFFLFLTANADAATFVSVKPIADIWLYHFSVKENPTATSEDLMGAEHNCLAVMAAKMNKALGNPHKCFNDEASARVAAQKKADDMERNMAKQRGH